MGHLSCCKRRNVVCEMETISWLPFALYSVQTRPTEDTPSIARSTPPHLNAEAPPSAQETPSNGNCLYDVTACLFFCRLRLSPMPTEIFTYTEVAPPPPRTLLQAPPRPPLHPSSSHHVGHCHWSPRRRAARPHALRGCWSSGLSDCCAGC